MNSVITSQQQQTETLLSLPAELKAQLPLSPQLAEQIAGQRQMKILYMSGYTDSVHLGAQAKGGKIQLLLKPFTPNALAQKVRTLLDEPAN